MGSLLTLPSYMHAGQDGYGFFDDFDTPTLRGSKDLPLGAFQEQDGTALADFADGASNVPGWSAGDESGGIRWNNAAAPDPISTQFTLPRDIDTGYDAILRIRCAKVGATIGDATTFTVEVFNNALAALYDADVDYGGASSAITGDAATKTVQESVLVLALANLGSAGDTVTLTIQPTDGTLGTDDIILLSVELDYVRKDQSWLLFGDDGGSAAVSDAVGGRISIATGAVDNDEYYIASPVERFLWANNKPAVLEARVQFTEASTDDANIIFGFCDFAVANALLDNGGGPPATYDGAVFYKVDGGTRWQVESSNAGTQTTTDTEHTAGGASFHTLRIQVEPGSDSANAEVSFWIDTAGGKNLAQCRETGINARDPDIRHTVAYSGLQEMHVILGAKAGGANAETLVVDYVGGWQKR